MSIISESISSSFSAIHKHKWFFLILILTQLLFFSVFSAVQYYYQVKILEEAKVVLDYLDENTDQSNIFGSDPLMISKHYKSIKQNVILLCFFTILVLIIFNCINWLITHKIINNKFRSLNYIYKFSAIYLVFIGLLAGFLYYAISASIGKAIVTGASDPIVNTFSVIFAAIIFYFMYPFLALAGSDGSLIKNVLKISIFKAHYLVLIYW